MLATKTIRSSGRRQLDHSARGLQSPSRSGSAANSIARSPNSYRGRKEPASSKTGRVRSPRGGGRMDATRYVGIDVSAATLDIAVHEGSLQERNDAKGIAAVVRELQASPPTLVGAR